MANASGNAPLSVTLSLMDKATAPLRKFNAAMQKMTAPAKSLKNTLKLRAAEIGLPKVGQAFVGVGKAAGGALKQVRSLGREFALLTGLGAGFLGGIVHSTASAGDAAYKTAQKVGVSTEAWTKMEHAAKMSNVSSEQLKHALGELNAMTLKAAGGNREALARFRALGINIRDSAGQLKPANALFEEAAERIARIEDPTRRAQAASVLWGKTLGPELVPLLAIGKAGMHGYYAEAERLKKVITDEQGLAASSFNDSLTRMKESFKGLAMTIGNQLLPVIEPFFKQIETYVIENGDQIAATVRGWIDSILRLVEAFGGWSRVIPVVVGGLAAIKLGPLIFSVVMLGKSIIGVGWTLMMSTGKLMAFLRVHTLLLGGLKLAGNVLWGVGGAFKAVFVPAAKGLLGFGKGALLVGKIMGGMLVKALFAVGGAIKAVGVAFLTTPIGWIALGIAALVGVFIYLWKNCESFRNFWLAMWDRVVGYISGAVDKIKAAFDQGIVQGILTIFAQFNPLRLFVEALDSVVEYLTGFSLMDAGAAIMTSLWDGLKSVWRSVTDWVTESINSLTGWMPEWMRDKLGLNFSVSGADAGASPDPAHSPYGPPVGVHDMIRKDSVSRSESTRDAKVTVDFANVPAGVGVKTQNVDQTRVTRDPMAYGYAGPRMGL